MTGKPIPNATAAQMWCPFVGTSRGPVPGQPNPPDKRPNYKTSDRCLVTGCCVWQDNGDGTGYCGLVS